jgi:hypothetical protein
MRLAPLDAIIGRFRLMTRLGAKKEQRAKNFGRQAESLEVVQLGGLEPPTSCSTDRRSNQLSYNCILGPRPKKGVAEPGGN